MRRGFTIVELLIVIVVIAILAAVVTVTYSGMKARAINSRSSQSLEIVEKALLIYKTEYDKPFYTEDPFLATYGLSGNQYYLGGNGMIGVCIASDWPADLTPDQWVGYCGINGTYHPYNQRAMTDMIKTLPLQKAFPSMPTMSLVNVAAVRSSGEVDNYAVQGIRYAFNGSTTAPLSYLYYASSSKQCLGTDTSVRVQSTVNIGIGPGGSFSGFSETGGDYTANNTQYCYRTFRW